MITSNIRLMKTQIVPGSYDAVSVFFPMPPTKARKSGRVDGGGPYFPQVVSEPAAAGRIDARRPARHDTSSLPASLQDWLICKAALEICRSGRVRTEDGDRARVAAARPATRSEEH